jgi:hypothetical protein
MKVKKIPILFGGLLLLVTLAYAGQDRVLPDPNLTPGEIMSAVTKEDICAPGYSQSVRHVPESEKKQVYQEYNMQPHKSPCPCEVDHLVSLELGGSNDIKNLWPQPYSGVWNAHMKDRLENWLHREVCKGNMTLQEAQAAIRGDWTKAYIKYGIAKVGNKGYIIKVVH